MFPFSLFTEVNFSANFLGFTTFDQLFEPSDAAILYPVAVLTAGKICISLPSEYLTVTARFPTVIFVFGNLCCNLSAKYVRTSCGVLPDNSLLLRTAN